MNTTTTIQYKWYLGFSFTGQAVPFQSKMEPTARTHGAVYCYVLGPFKTKRGCMYASKNCYGPCLQTVSQFERIARKEVSK